MCACSDRLEQIRTVAKGPNWGQVLLNGTVMYQGHGVPKMVSPAMRTTLDLLVFLNLTKMSCSVLPLLQAAWQVILIGLKSS